MPVKNYVSRNGQVEYEYDDLGDILTYGRDALGNVVAGYDAATNAVFTADYKPYGEFAATTGNVAGRRFMWVGSWGYRFTSGVPVSHYVRARHLSMRMGMWTSVDPLWPEQLEYNYLSGRVIGSIDYLGLFSISKPSCGPCAPLNAVRILRGEETRSYVWVHPSGRPSSLTECLQASRKFGRNCVCVNGGFFGGGGPIGTVVPSAIPPASGNGKPIPSVVLQGPGGVPKRMPPIIAVSGSASGSVAGRPWSDTPDASLNRARTGACVDARGTVIGMIIVPAPPGATAMEMEACMESACEPGTKPVSLDGGSSTQVGLTGRVEPLVRSSRRRPEPVHNWFVICDGKPTGDR